jgi:hypothetical protein
MQRAFETRVAAAGPYLAERANSLPTGETDSVRRTLSLEATFPEYMLHIAVFFVVDHRKGRE